MREHIDVNGLLIVAPYPEHRAGDTRIMSYQGFDGIIWPGSTDLFLEDGLVSKHRLSEVLSVFQVSGQDEARLLFLRTRSNDQPPNDQFRFLGYDVGWFNSSYSKFSFILNELMGGLGPSGEWLLNTFGLFEHHQIGQDYLLRRIHLHDPRVETLPCDAMLGVFEVFLYGSKRL